MAEGPVKNPNRLCLSGIWLVSESRNRCSFGQRHHTWPGAVTSLRPFMNVSVHIRM